MAECRAVPLPLEASVAPPPALRVRCAAASSAPTPSRRQRATLRRNRKRTTNTFRRLVKRFFPAVDRHDFGARLGSAIVLGRGGRVRSRRAREHLRALQSVQPTF
eukprot:5402451-Pyramimonas_sp.AAC.2